MDYNVGIGDVETVLLELNDLFPSLSKIALLHDAEEKLKVALYLWRNGQRDVVTSLVSNACLDLYRVAKSLSET